MIFLLRFFSWLDNFSYKVLSFLAIKNNGGIHPKHQIMDYHKFFLDNIAENAVILDIGCGNGAVAFDLAKKASKVIAIDIEEKNIKTAKNKFSADNLEYIVGDATTYDFQDRFDAIVLSNVLEHIKDRIYFLKKIKKLSLKILIRVPLLTRDWLSVYKKNIGVEYRLDKTHFIEYTEDIFSKEMQAAGLKVEKMYTEFGELYVVTKTL